MSLTVPQTDLDLQVILTDLLKFEKPSEFEHYFEAKQEGTKLFLTVQKDKHGSFVWVPKEGVWTPVNDYVRGLGGAWEPKLHRWEIPLKQGTDSETTYKESGNELPTPPSTPTSTPMDTPIETPMPLKPDAHERMENNLNNLKEAGEQLEGDGYDLKKSKEALGTLIPILTDAHGNIIDGFHREKIDADWPRVKARHITDPVHLSMARLAANVCRRDVPPEEKTKLLANIAELTGWDAKGIAEAIGMSEKWVRQYLPSEFKNQEMASIAHQRFANRETQDMTQTPTPPGRGGIEGSNESHAEPSSFESESITPTVPVEKIDTGLIFECPECGFKATHIHISSKHHKLEEVQEF